MLYKVKGIKNIMSSGRNQSFFVPCTRTPVRKQVVKRKAMIRYTIQGWIFSRVENMRCWLVDEDNKRRKGKLKKEMKAIKYVR